MKKIRNAVVVIYGQHSPDWMQALGPDAPVWPLILDAGRVLHVTAHDDLSGLAARGEDVVVIPLLENHIRTAPTGFASLVPKPDVLDIFADKALFHRDMQHGGFSANLPKLFSSALSATFPCVLKRTDLNGGVGVVQARSPGDLFGLRHEGLWADQPVLIEEFIPGAKEYVTHVVCSEGRILWHHTFQYVMRDDDPIRRSSSRYAFTSTRLEPATLGVFAKILAAFGYDGPANIDFKMRRSRPVVLEINPRLGGSLMRPENTRILAQSLREIIRAAMQKSSLRPALSDVS